jgi:hypothetical protein
VVQPPDAENGMSGGVGGVTGAIRSPRPDLEKALPVNGIPGAIYRIGTGFIYYSP